MTIGEFEKSAEIPAKVEHLHQGYSDFRFMSLPTHVIRNNFERGRGTNQNKGALDQNAMNLNNLKTKLPFRFWKSRPKRAYDHTSLRTWSGTTGGWFPFENAKIKRGDRWLCFRAPASVTNFDLEVGFFFHEGNQNSQEVPQAIFDAPPAVIVNVDHSSVVPLVFDATPRGFKLKFIYPGMPSCQDFMATPKFGVYVEGVEVPLTRSERLIAAFGVAFVQLGALLGLIKFCNEYLNSREVSHLWGSFAIFALAFLGWLRVQMMKSEWSSPDIG